MDISMFNEIEKVKLAAFFDEFEKTAGPNHNRFLPPSKSWTGSGMSGIGSILGAGILPLVAGATGIGAIPLAALGAYLGHHSGGRLQRTIMDDRTRLAPEIDPEVLMKSPLFGTLSRKEQEHINNIAGLKQQSNKLKELGASMKDVEDAGVDPTTITTEMRGAVNEFREGREADRTRGAFNFDKMTGKDVKNWAVENPGTAAVGAAGTLAAAKGLSDWMGGSGGEEKKKKGNTVIVA